MNNENRRYLIEVRAPRARAGRSRRVPLPGSRSVRSARRPPAGCECGDVSLTLRSNERRKRTPTPPAAAYTWRARPAEGSTVPDATHASHVCPRAERAATPTGDGQSSQSGPDTATHACINERVSLRHARPAALRVSQPLPAKFDAATARYCSVLSHCRSPAARSPSPSRRPERRPAPLCGRAAHQPLSPLQCSRRTGASVRRRPRRADRPRW